MGMKRWTFGRWLFVRWEPCPPAFRSGTFHIHLPGPATGPRDTVSTSDRRTTTMTTSPTNGADRFGITALLKARTTHVAHCNFDPEDGDIDLGLRSAVSRPDSDDDGYASLSVLVSGSPAELQDFLRRITAAVGQALGDAVAAGSMDLDTALSSVTLGNAAHHPLVAAAAEALPPQDGDGDPTLGVLVHEARRILRTWEDDDEAVTTMLALLRRIAGDAPDPSEAPWCARCGKAIDGPTVITVDGVCCPTCPSGSTL